MLRFVALAVALLMFSAAAFGGPIYLRSSSGPPWGSSSNESAMDRVFGTGNWSEDYYETVDLNALLPSADFIFMEGGADNDTALNSFLTTNSAALETWATSGGRMLIQSAGWNTSIAAPFGVVLNLDPVGYTTGSSTGTFTTAGASLLSGPFAPTGTSWNGTYLSHDYITGSNLRGLITDDQGRMILSYMTSGTGMVVYSGLTTDNFHSPLPEVENLTGNIVAFAAVPEPASLALAGLALTALGLLKRRR